MTQQNGEGHFAIVVPLEDGTFAVYANDKAPESLIIVSDPDNLSMAITSRANMRARISPSRPEPLDVDFGELGL